MAIPLFDAHCDTLSRLLAEPEQHLLGNGGQWDLSRTGGLAPQAQIFAAFADSALPGAMDQAARQIALFHRECRLFSDRIALCTNGRQAAEAVRNGRVAAFLSVEGGELLNCSEAGLRQAHRQGVRAVNLTWNRANALSGSHCEEPERGLSAQGKRFVREMHRLGMLVDVSHLSEMGFWNVLELEKKPVIASHSNSQAVFFHTRNLTDNQFTAIIEYRGVVGLNAYAGFLSGGGASAADLLKHLEHFLALGGAETVALGGDWDGCDALPEGYTGVWNWADFYNTLLQHNYPESLVRDLFYDNLMRTVNAVCIT